jgi:putative peptidoglycan lipid II flippase
MKLFWQRLRPLLLIPVILQGSIAVERAVGSLLGVEVVAATEYARYVVDSCMSLLAAPLGLAGLAAFARMASTEVGGGLRRLIPPVLLVTVPMSAILCVNSRGIVTLLYARGEFNQQAVDVSATLLLGFALGIWAQVLGYALVKVLNARAATFPVATIMAASFGAAAALNLLLYRHLGPITLGVSASVGGLITFAMAAGWLSVLRFSFGFLAILLPGAGATAAVGFLLSGPSLTRLVMSTVGMALLWAGYVALVPRLRQAFLLGIWAKLRPGRRPSTAQPLPAGDDRDQAALDRLPQ